MKKRFLLSEIGQFLVLKSKFKVFWDSVPITGNLERFLSDSETIIFVEKIPLNLYGINNVMQLLRN